MPELAEWDSFYLIVGGAAGALIGLQFVVMTLIADRPAVQQSSEAGSAYATPTTIHFVVVLLIAALLRVPWKGAAVASIMWGILGVVGVVYVAIVVRRMQAQNSYRPVFEDWLFHALLPFVAYAVLAISALAANSNLHDALFGIAASAVLLLLVGIHNSWDMTTYNVFVLKPKTESGPPDQPEGADDPQQT